MITRIILAVALLVSGLAGNRNAAAQPGPHPARNDLGMVDRQSSGPRLTASRAKVWPGFAESLSRRASFTRDYVGGFATPRSDETTDTVSMPAQWSNGKTIAFAWAKTGKVYFASFTRSGKPAVQPQIICDGEAPVIAGNDTNFAVAAKSSGGSIVAVRDEDGWLTSSTLPIAVYSLAFSPAGDLYTAGPDGIHRQVGQEFQQVSTQAFEQPCLAFDGSGTSHVAHLKNGRIFFDDTDLSGGTNPALLFDKDGTGWLAYLINGAIALRKYSAGAWQEPEMLAAGRAPAWPALGKSGTGVRLSHIGPAAVGPPALWLIPLPEKEPVLMPSVSGNVVEGWLLLHFALRQNRDLYRPHDVQILVNDLEVAQFRSTVPDGRYLFKLNPAQVFTSPGGAAVNRVRIKSRHMNPGHYSVSSNYQLIVRTEWSEHWNFGSGDDTTTDPAAASSGERAGVNHHFPDLTVLANGVDLQVQAPSGGKLKLNVQVANIGEARSEPAELKVKLDSAQVSSALPVPELDPGELTTIPLDLLYDENAARLELTIAAAQKDFDPGNDALEMTLWTTEAERQRRAERLRQAQAIGYRAETTASVISAGPGLTSGTVTTGIELQIGDWVPPFDDHGWWGATTAGGDPKSIKDKNAGTTALSLSPGEYDVYWHQGYYGTDVCLARAVRIEPGKITRVNADSGFAIEPAQWVPKFDGYGWWGVTVTGGDPAKPLTFTHDRKPLLVPPGKYDVYWKQEYAAPPVLLQSGASVAEHQLVTVSADSGVRLTRSDRVPRFDGYGWWGVARKGEAEGKPLTFTDGEDVLLLKPDEYDVLWKQNYANRPITITTGVIITSGSLAEVRANTGIELRKAAWVPKFDGYGWWGAALPGETEALNTSVEPGMLLLPSGTYDILWKQEYAVPPVTLARSVQVAGGKIAEHHVNAGVALEKAQWIPKFDSYGWWGAVPKDKAASDRLNWNDSGNPLVLPAGEYDIYWKQRYTENPIPFARGVTVSDGNLVTVKAGSGIAVKIFPESEGNRKISISSTGSSETVTIKRDLEKRSANATDQVPANMHFFLPPGTYNVELLESGNNKPIAAKPQVNVSPGTLLEVDLTAVTAGRR